MEEQRWTLDELAERVDAALAVDYPGQPSGRVRDVPDRRAIRWYTTIGLIDRPVAHQGRIALYGPRHLLQLVAVKRLQAKGLPLVAIQQELAGATDTELGRVARVPTVPAVPAGRAVPASPSVPATPATPATPAGPATPASPPRAHAGSPAGRVAAGLPARRLVAGPVGRAAFWREPPVAALAAAAAGGPTELAGTSDTVAGAVPTDPEPPILAATGAVPPPADGVATLRGVRLGEGATLLLEPGRDLDAADLNAILDAARPLLAVLADRRLAPRRRAADGEPRREHP
jgi:hypothetical protein